jgi:hypothetical protein
MRRICIAAAVLLLMVHAAVAQGKATSWGAGVTSCAEFSKSYQATPKITEDYYFSWTMGFLSGMNASPYLSGKPESVKRLNALSAEDAKRFLRLYCHRNPLAEYGEAVLKLWERYPEVQP